jgi:hypothetical protein
VSSYSAATGDQFLRDGSRPAFLFALWYQFFHNVQAAAYIAGQFMPTPLAGSRFGISPDHFQSMHATTPAAERFVKLDRSVCIRWEYCPDARREQSLLSYVCVM